MVIVQSVIVISNSISNIISKSKLTSRFNEEESKAEGETAIHQHLKVKISKIKWASTCATYIKI